MDDEFPKNYLIDIFWSL